MNEHMYWMNRALVLARKGLGFVHPNPMVGAIVLDKNGKLVGEGYHSKFGSHHAETVAIKNAGKKAIGGTLYVTLEPCCHHGKTPPCTDAIIQSGIKKVIVACADPNPKVSGKGIEKLKNADLHIETGVCETRAKKLNEAFFHCIQTGKPFVRAKVAMTVDGFIGQKDQRLMLSGPTIEKITMRLRAESQAIVVGAGTVLADNPRLNVRGKYKDRKPVRVIIDPELKTPISSNVFDKKAGPVWIFCNEETKNSNVAKSFAKHAELIFSPTHHERISISFILDELQKREMTSILVEGGAGLLDRFMQASAIHQWVIYLNSKNLKVVIPADKLVKLPHNPLFSLEFQSVIRRDQDLVITGSHVYRHR